MLFAAIKPIIGAINKLMQLFKCASACRIDRPFYVLIIKAISGSSMSDDKLCNVDYSKTHPQSILYGLERVKTAISSWHVESFVVAAAGVNFAGVMSEEAIFVESSKFFSNTIKI